MRFLFVIFGLCLGGYSWAQKNVTIDYIPLQLTKFKMDHPDPIGLLTTSAGNPVDIRKIQTLNTNLWANPFFAETILHGDKPRIPERIAQAKGTGAHGYFVVTHDVSKYTSAAMFNGIGKKTPAFGRFSSMSSSLGGSDLTRDSKGVSIKYYTEEGNFDHLSLHIPVFALRNPTDFHSVIRTETKNPKTDMVDLTQTWDMRTKRPDLFHFILWKMSEYGIPYGFRRMNFHPIHTYEIYNKHGDKFYVRFNYRTEQGLANLTTAEAQAITSQDPDYFRRDLYNAIENKDYPSWRLEMDVISYTNLMKLKYNPFDVTKLWESGTYQTVMIGRLILNRNVDNFFREVEQSAFNPGNLVPGISGPMDFVYTARVVAYRDVQDYRLGVNHNKIEINLPKYAKSYLRDGVPPVRHNMKDSPNYLHNSFNGPLPYIDESAPSERLLILESNAVDFENVAEFYNHMLKTEESRKLLAQNIAANLETVQEPVKSRVIKMLSLINSTLGKRVAAALPPAPDKPMFLTKEAYAPLARCVEAFSP